MSIKIGIGKLRIGVGGSQSWEQQWQEIASDEYQAIYDAMVVKPTGLDLAVQNWFVYQMKAKNLWTKFDIIRFYGAQSNDNKEALIDWKNPTDSASLMKSPYGTFNNGTEIWVVYGANTCVNLGTEIKISYVNNESGAYRVLSTTYIESTTAGKPYTIRARCKIESGTAYLREVYSQTRALLPITTSEYAWYELSFVRSASGIAVQITTAVGTVVYCDEYYVIESHKAVAVNAPTFTQSQGFTGIPVSNTYINQLYVPSLSGVKYTLNSASHIIYIINNLPPSDTYANGAVEGAGSSRIGEFPFKVGKLFTSTINCINQCISTDNLILSGLYINNRTANDNLCVLKNGEIIASGTEAATALPARNIASLASSFQDGLFITPSFYNGHKLFFEAFGEGLSQAEAEDTSEVINAAASYLGINVYNNNYKFDKPILVLTFDNGDSGWKSTGLPYFISKGCKATFYVLTSQVDNPIFQPSWNDIIDMYNAGMDMQCHSDSHSFLDTLTEEQIITDLETVNAKFTAHGLPIPKHIAYPNGVYNDTVKSVVSTLRLTGRSFTGASESTRSQFYPVYKYIDKFILPSMQMDRGTDDAATTRAEIKNLIDRAIYYKCAVILTGHNISNADDGFTNISDLDYWIDYARANDMDIMTMSEFYELLDK